MTRFKRLLEAILFSTVSSTILPQFQFEHALLCSESSSYLLISEKVPQDMLEFLPAAHDQIILQVTGMGSVLMAVSHQHGMIDDDFKTGEI